MDLVRIIRSIEELIYEVVTWLVFYPRTLWFVLRNPRDIVRFSEAQARCNHAQSLSPPLLLLLSIVLAHLLELAARLELPRTRLFDSDFNLVVFRSTLFSVFALSMAVAVVRHARKPLDREVLRSPFFAQCYLTAPFALVVSSAAVVARLSMPRAKVVALGMLALALAWYVWAATSCFQAELRLPRVRALAFVLTSFARALAEGALVAFAFAGLLSH